MPLPAGDPEDFRRVMRVFPTPVSVVTALDEQGLPRGLTCSALCSLSMDPPSLLVCVNRRNGSLRAIRHSRGFVVNLLRAGRDEVSDAFASNSARKFDGRPWQPSPVSGLPLLTGDALAFVDCDLHAQVEAGSHVILIGLVRQSETNGPALGPLVYWRSAYGRWAPGDISRGGSMSYDALSARILVFIRERFLSGDEGSRLDEDTPLLEWGVLNSLNTAVLLGFLREELGVPVPAARITGGNFKSVRSIAAMVEQLADGAESPVAR